jgi:hypothetical protein
MITAAEVTAAQDSWGNAVVHVGAASDWNTAHARAVELVERHYRLDGSLLFAPTKAKDIQFRNHIEAAVSYFVGNNDSFPEDKGFALEPWTSVRFENTGVVIRGQTGIAMGNYFFGKADGSETKVEYSFVYVQDAAGQLKIQLHHSALPFSG